MSYEAVTKTTKRSTLTMGNGSGASIGAAPVPPSSSFTESRVHTRWSSALQTASLRPAHDRVCAAPVWRSRSSGQHSLRRQEMLKNVCAAAQSFTLGRWRNRGPIVDWLRALSRKVHAECGGRGVGAVGMCFTGNFALAMMTEPSVVAPVLFPTVAAARDWQRQKPRLACSPEEIAVCQAPLCRRRPDHDRCLRFRGDPFVSDSRFDNYKQTFGDRFWRSKLMPKTVAAFRRAAPFRAHRQLA